MMSAMLFILDKVDKAQAQSVIRHNFYASQGTADSVNTLLEELQHELR